MRTFFLPFARLLAAGLVCWPTLLFLPATAEAFHYVRVRVTVTEVENTGRRCFDQVVICESPPDYRAVIKFNDKSNPMGSWVDPTGGCKTGVIGNQDHIKPTDWTCSADLERPVKIRVEIWDFDGGINALLSGGGDHADIRQGAGQDFDFDVEPFLAGRFPSVPPGPAERTFTTRGEDTEVRLTIRAEVLPGTLKAERTSPQTFDPSIGQVLKGAVEVSEETSLTISITGPSGKVREYAVRPQAGRAPFEWDGRDAQANVVPPSTYTIGVAGWDLGLFAGPREPTNPLTETLTAQVVKQPPSVLWYLGLDRAIWNPRAGPLYFDFSLGARGTAGLRAFAGGANCTNQQLLRRTIPAQSVPAGPSRLSWDGRDSQNNFVPPGNYSVEVFAYDAAGNKTVPPAMCLTNITVIPPPPLELAVEHAPLSPAIGNVLSFTATALDATHAPRLTGTIEIWLADSTAVANGQRPSAPTKTCLRSETCELTLPNLTQGAGRIAYAAVAYDIEGARVEAPWRLVDIVAQRGATPVMAGVSWEQFGGVVRRDKAIDIVFFPGSNYELTTSIGRNEFFDDVQRHIKRLWGLPLSGFPFQSDGQPSALLKRQKRISFWISMQSVTVTRADRFNFGSLCNFSAPTVSFADVSAVVHRIGCRDNAPGKTYSANSPFVSWHEFHHAAFGLADEYCCDGGYFQADPHPNLYFWTTDCMKDPLADLAVGCPIIPSTHGPPYFNWSRVDPDTQDVMINNTRERRSDERRVNWVLDQCDVGQC